MFDSPVCSYCEQWEDEIAETYPKTEEGKKTTLRRVSIHDDVPNDLRKLKPIIYTPTFVLVRQGQELGRIPGYAGEDFFWGFLETLIAKLPKNVSACNKAIHSTAEHSEEAIQC